MNLSKVLLIFLFTAVLSASATYLVVKSTPAQVKELAEVHIQALGTPAKKCPYRVERINGYEYTKPLLYGAPTCEPDKYVTIKSELTSIIDGYKKDGTLSSASVYLIDFDRAEWMSINGDSAFHPGSLMKLPILITYLKMSEKKPDLLSTKLRYTKTSVNAATQSSANKHIEAGKVYSIRELLEYMIKYSDNNATYLLNENIDLEALKKTFAELNLTTPDINNPNLRIKAADYSTFFIVLYNAGYLTMDASEYAMTLLSETDINNGFKDGLPQEVSIAHRYGQWTDNKGNQEIHESGIIYLNDKAYVLTVLTKGMDAEKLKGVISKVTKTVYDNINTALAAEDANNMNNKTL